MSMVSVLSLGLTAVLALNAVAATARTLVNEYDCRVVIVLEDDVVVASGCQVEPSNCPESTTCHYLWEGGQGPGATRYQTCWCCTLDGEGNVTSVSGAFPDTECRPIVVFPPLDDPWVHCSHGLCVEGGACDYALATLATGPISCPCQ